MNRDFIGALLQLNAEKDVPREQLVHTVEDAIQSAYRRVAPGYEDVHVTSTLTPAGCACLSRHQVVDRGRGPAAPSGTWTRPRHTSPTPSVGDLVEYEELDPDHFGRVGAQIAGQVVRQRLREAERENLFDEFAHRDGGDHHGHRQPGRAARRHPRPRQGRGRAAHHGPVGDRALPHRPARQGVRDGGPADDPRPADLRQPHPQELPASPVRARGARRSTPVPWRSRPSRARRAAAARSRCPAARRVSTRSAPPSASGAAASSRSSRSWAARRSTSSRGPTTRPRSSPTRCQPGTGGRRRDRRGEPDRGGHRARADALAGHRPRGPERPPGGQAHRLAHRHPERPGAAPRGTPRVAASAGAPTESCG